METNNNEATVQQVNNLIELIDTEQKLTTKQLAEKLNELIARVNELQGSSSTTRDRGPKSEKEMNEDDARRIMLGDLKDVSHKECAVKLGLSYGQVYSARKGFTFKPVYQEMVKGSKVAQEQ